MCPDGSYACSASDCPPADPEVIITAADAIISDGMAYVDISYHSSVDVAGIQFTLSDEPEVAVSVGYSTDNSDFTASANDADGDVTTVFFSLTGASLPATDESTVFATLEYELTAELGDDEVATLHFLDGVCASGAGTSLVSAGVDGSLSTGSSSMPGDTSEVPAPLAHTPSKKCRVATSSSPSSAVISYSSVAKTVDSSVAGKEAPVKLKNTVVTSPSASLALAVKSELSVL
jgi:hypothetical protein